MFPLSELPDDINYDLIDLGLYLGNLTTALDVTTLKKLKISCILTVASEPLPNSVKEILPYITLFFIKVDDMPSCDLLSHFDDSCQFINSALCSGGNVLVHCYFGVSRSATLVAAHLMKKYRINSFQALERLRSRRRCVGPNEGFLQQLALYGALGCTLEGSNRSSALYRLHSFKGVVASIRTEPHRLKEFVTSFVSQLQQDPPVNASPGFMCKYCSIVLCSKNSVLDHPADDANLIYPGKGPSRLIVHPPKFQSINPSAAPANLIPICRRAFYMLPQPWMLDKNCDVTTKLCGAIFCFQCKNKLGSYHWLSGVQCYCYTQPSSNKPWRVPLNSSTGPDYAAVILLDAPFVTRC